MPRKRRLGILRRRVISLDDLIGAEILDLLVAWAPPGPGRERGHARWGTWEDFLGDYETMRDEFLASSWAERGPEPFAEWLRRRTGGDPERVADLERAGARIVAAAVARYPATYTNPVSALYREETG